MAGSASLLLCRYVQQSTLCMPKSHKPLPIKAPTINAECAPGWMGSKHFLVKDAIATVASTECREDGFVFGLRFDNDCKDQFENGVPIKEKPLYHFHESFIEGST